MKTIVKHPSQERLRELFEYREDGYLVWKVHRSRARVGSIAGGVYDHKYRRVRVGPAIHMAHRLIWIWHYGDIPDGRIIDHIDGDKLNNRIENLRPLSNRDNCHRERSAKRALPRNVSKDRKGFVVRFTVDGKTRNFGTYPTVEEAAEVAERERARRQIMKRF